MKHAYTIGGALIIVAISMSLPFFVTGPGIIALGALATGYVLIKLSKTFTVQIRRRTPVKFSVKEIGSNPDMREYHTNVAISSNVSSYINFPVSLDCRELSTIGPTGREIITGLTKIPGIVSVFLIPYILTVSKADLFEWEDIDSQVMALLQKAAGDLDPDVPAKIESSSKSFTDTFLMENEQDSEGMETDQDDFLPVYGRDKRW